MPDDLTLLHAEMARREMARRWYSDYLPYVYGKNWKQTRIDLCNQRLSQLLEITRTIETEN